MPYLVGLIILYLVFFFIEKGWQLSAGWAMRAFIITIGAGVIGFVLLLIYVISTSK